ncbi:MAG: tRNA lysidine(34) synthetase TilS [Gemmatimonadota bacterium]|nr:tRNA lysidine(34) synthetase TilS [Gemmatimonadota bacterium]
MTSDRTSSTVREIERSVAATAAEAARPLVLAVSGGLDSMALLDAAARVARRRIAVVASFDHGSGPQASRATDFVCGEAAARGLPAVAGHAERRSSGEAAWREARWEFLRTVARRVRGVVVTAHTEDDQVETVLMRAMRGAGARGLAGLYAPAADVRRPFVGVRRAALESYVATRGVRWVTDPTNSSRRYFRNRVRHELLPALLRVQPTLDAELLDLARRATTLRAELDAAAERISPGEASTVSVAARDVAGYDAELLAALWPALAARVGLALDWRGTERLVAFTTSVGRAGASMQLAGGWEVVRDRNRLTLRQARGATPEPASLPLAGALRWGRWSFVRQGRSAAAGPWQAVLPANLPLRIRAWQPGDRITGSAGTPRRVKRFFGDAGIIGPDRAGWPVVLAGEEIVWIPGVGRGVATAGSSGTPGLTYSCEFNDR